jgi:transcriptional regulator with XRE-family HTH domain
VGDVSASSAVCLNCARARSRGPGGCRCIPEQFWRRPDAAAALAREDVTRLIQILCRKSDLTQEEVARLTGLDQSMISRVVSGKRSVATAARKQRALHGLGAPTTTATGYVAEEETDEVRRLLAHAAQVTVGVLPTDAGAWPLPPNDTAACLPARVSAVDIDQLGAVTDALRAADYRYGGGACRDAIIAHTRRARAMLERPRAPGVDQRLHQALADLHNLAGWTEFDIGAYSAARRNFAHALQHAHLAEQPSLAANVLYRMGRLHLHRGLHADALKFLQLGQLAAQNSGCGVTVAMLHANEAWVYALTQQEAHATQALNRAQEEFARADRATTPHWARWFGDADLNAMVGVVNAALPTPSPRAYEQAVATLNRSLTLRGADMTRSRAFELSALATTHLVNGNTDAGLDAGRSAVHAAQGLRSSRVIDRLTPLAQAARHINCAEARDLTAQIATLRRK